jgi:hypothetical protein
MLKPFEGSSPIKTVVGVCRRHHPSLLLKVAISAPVLVPNSFVNCAFFVMRDFVESVMFVSSDDKQKHPAATE